MKIAFTEIETQSRAALIAHGAGDMQARHVSRAVAHAEALGKVICGVLPRKLLHPVGVRPGQWHR